MAIAPNPDGYLVGSSDPTPTPGDEAHPVDELLSTLPGFSVLTKSMKDAALAQALMPDVNGVWPGKLGYITTHDLYWAAIRLVAFMQAQPVLRQTSSEGTSLALDAPNWAGVLAYYRSMSPVSQASGGGVLTAVPIPGGPHVAHTDMSGVDSFGRRTEYGDSDTDLS